MASRPTTFDDWQDQSLVVIPEPTPEILAKYSYDEWKNSDEDELVSAIKKTGDNGLDNAIKRGLMLWTLKAKDGVKLDEDYCTRHDLGELDYSTAGKLIILARSPRTHLDDWTKDTRPRSWRTMHELVKFNPRAKERPDGPEIGKYAIRNDVFEQLRKMIGQTTARDQVLAYATALRTRYQTSGRLPNRHDLLPNSFVNTVSCGDCIELTKRLPDNSVGCVITSPPYGDQRKDEYPSIPEDEFPDWFAGYMDILWPKLTIDGNVIVVLGSQVHDGRESNYVNRTRDAVLALPGRWEWPQRLIWHKLCGTPVGSTRRFRKQVEDILWFSKTTKPYVNLKACGNTSNRIGATGSSNHKYGRSIGYESGTARSTDLFIVNSSQVDKNVIYKGVKHPAMFPPELVRQFLLTFARPGCVVLDPFCGSGTVPLNARKYGYSYIGFDIEQIFVDMTSDRLLHDKSYKG